MDDRFVEVIAEVEGIESPATIRMRELSEIVHSQILEERLNGCGADMTSELYDKIFGDYDED